jgi:hypothetical protein
MGLFDDVAKVVKGRFTPSHDLTRTKKEDRTTTLYSAVMEHLGFDLVDSVLSARNHGEIRRAVRWFYSVLDEVTGERSEPWAMRPERTEAEVLKVLGEASKRYPFTEFDLLTADLRIGLTKVAGRGKMRGALACEVAYLRGVDFAQVIGRLADDDLSDCEVLDELEAVPGEMEAKAADWKIAAGWALAYNTFTSKDSSDTTLGAFCRWLSDEWGEMTDERLTERLQEVSGAPK